MKNKYRRVTVALKHQEFRKLKLASAEREMSMSALIKELIEQHVPNVDYQPLDSTNLLPTPNESVL